MTGHLDYPLTKTTEEENKHFLALLCKSEELGEMELLEGATFDTFLGGTPAICVTPDCGYTSAMEPDQDRGWCEECDKNTVKSCLVLAGLV